MVQSYNNPFYPSLNLLPKQNQSIVPYMISNCMITSRQVPCYMGKSLYHASVVTSIRHNFFLHFACVKAIKYLYYNLSLHIRCLYPKCGKVWYCDSYGFVHKYVGQYIIFGLFVASNLLCNV